MTSKRVLNLRKILPLNSISIDDSINKIKNYSSDTFTTKSGKTLNLSSRIDESINVDFKLNIDPKKTENLIRSGLLLNIPHGRKNKILAICSDKQAAINSGAFDAIDPSELKDLIATKYNFKKFDYCITSQDCMPLIASSGASKILGMSGIMPSVKIGTVFKTQGDLIASINSYKCNFIELRTDKFGYIRSNIAKINHSFEDIKSNISQSISHLNNIKPSSCKSSFISKLHISTTFGFSCIVDFNI